MTEHRFGSWLGPALGFTGIAAGLLASDAAQGGAFMGLLVGSVFTVLGVSRLGRPRQSA